jgi:uncharacterized membrane protein/mannose-6-phosphate isomerase-like protein (cupin superfamily)
MSLKHVDITESFARFKEQWSPKIVGELNGQMVKLVRFQGEFVWHRHEHEDEMFLVVAGEFRMELRDGNVDLKTGQFLIVPRGVEHRPVAAGECWVVLFEPARRFTGNVRGERTLDRLSGCEPGGRLNMSGALEAFSDGVIAILITIMVLELRAPHGSDLASLRPLLTQFGCYATSFAFLGIYWNNHHHMLHAVRHVDGRILWANMHLLFWLSLVPFATAWVGDSHFAAMPVAIYGLVLLLSGCAYYWLSRLLIARHGADSPLARAVGSDFKGRLSIVMYLAAVAAAFVAPWISCLLYLSVAIMWIVPDRRIEKVLAE